MSIKSCGAFVGIYRLYPKNKKKDKHIPASFHNNTFKITSS